MAIMEPTDWRTWVITPEPEPAADPEPQPPPGRQLAAPADAFDPPCPPSLHRQRALLREWAGRAYLSQLEHAVAADGYGRLNRLLGVPAVATATFVAASVLTSLVETGTLGPLTKIAVAVAGVTCATLSAMQTFFSHGVTAMAHQRYWAEYESILRRIEMLRSELPSGEQVAPIEAESAARFLRGRLRDLKEHIERVDRGAPSIPARYLRSAQRRADLRRVQGHEPTPV